jgi:hypothetical protein
VLVVLDDRVVDSIVGNKGAVIVDFKAAQIELVIQFVLSDNLIEFAAVYKKRINALWCAEKM